MKFASFKYDLILLSFKSQTPIDLNNSLTPFVICTLRTYRRSVRIFAQLRLLAFFMKNCWILRYNLLKLQFCEKLVILSLIYFPLGYQLSISRKLLSFNENKMKIMWNFCFVFIAIFFKILNFVKNVLLAFSKSY